MDQGWGPFGADLNSDTLKNTERPLYLPRAEKVKKKKAKRNEEILTSSPLEDDDVNLGEQLHPIIIVVHFIKVNKTRRDTQQD